MAPTNWPASTLCAGRAPVLNGILPFCAPRLQHWARGLFRGRRPRRVHARKQLCGVDTEQSACRRTAAVLHNRCVARSHIHTARACAPALICAYARAALGACACVPHGRREFCGGRGEGPLAHARRRSPARRVCVAGAPSPPPGSTALLSATQGAVLCGYSSFGSGSFVEELVWSPSTLKIQFQDSAIHVMYK